MSGIEESNFRGGNIAFVGLGTSRQKERIIATPHRKQRWLVFTKVGLKLRIERDIAGVVAEQIKLYLVHPRPCHVKIVKRVAVRGNEGRIINTVRVLPI